MNMTPIIGKAVAENLTRCGYKVTGYIAHGPGHNTACALLALINQHTLVIAPKPAHKMVEEVKPEVYVMTPEKARKEELTHATILFLYIAVPARFQIGIGPTCSVVLEKTK